MLLKCPLVVSLSTNWRQLVSKGDTVLSSSILSLLTIKWEVGFAGKSSHTQSSRHTSNQTPTARAHGSAKTGHHCKMISGNLFMKPARQARAMSETNQTGQLSTLSISSSLSASRMAWVALLHTKQGRWRARCVTKNSLTELRQISSKQTPRVMVLGSARTSLELKDFEIRRFKNDD